MPTTYKPKMLSYQIDKLGILSTLVEYVKSGLDSYGDETYTKTLTTVKAIRSVVTNTRMPFQRRGELGHYYMMQVEFFLKDVDEDGNTISTANSSVARPRELIYENNTYEVTEIEDSGIGAIRLISYRERQ